MTDADPLAPLVEAQGLLFRAWATSYNATLDAVTSALRGMADWAFVETDVPVVDALKLAVPGTPGAVLSATDLTFTDLDGKPVAKPTADQLIAAADVSFEPAQIPPASGTKPGQEAVLRVKKTHPLATGFFVGKVKADGVEHWPVRVYISGTDP